MRNAIIAVLLFISSCVFGQKGKAPKETRLLFVFDASKSMSSAHGDVTRMEAAKELFFRFIDSLGKDKTMQFALRMYGHTVKYPPGDCKDSRLVVPFAPGNLNTIKQKVREASPTGITPIEHSLTEAANDFKDIKTNNIVIIITDGIEECGGDPCLARKKLVEKGITFRPFIIGIGLSPEQIKTFECVGTFYDIEADSVFSSITGIIQRQKLLRSTAQVNLFDKNSKPLETDVNMTFYDTERGEYKHNFIHTMNQAGNPDTLLLDEYPTYKVVAHTIPPRESAEIRLNPGKHTIIPIDAPQGSLTVSRGTGAYNFNEKVKCVVRRSGEMNTINVQVINSTDKYITGNYDIEILTLPRIVIEGNTIEQSTVNLIEIPSAGALLVKCLEAGDGCILQKKNSKLDWVCNLGTQTTQAYYLQPGEYVGVWRARSLKGSIYTIERKFSIRSHDQTVVEFYR